MDTTTIASSAGVVIAMIIVFVLQSRRNAKLISQLEPKLRERGPLTLPELEEALGSKGFYKRGKIVLALNDAISAGRLEAVPAPPGTPQLQKVKHIRYRLRA